MVKQWHRKFLEHRRAYGEALFSLARQWAEAGRGAEAYQLLHEVLWENPQHTRARQVLGYRSLETPDRVRRRSGTKRHPNFGWEARQYWQIESEHYRVTTSHSVEAGVELAEKLEALHTVWRQVFFSYWSAAESLADRLAGIHSPLGRAAKHEVVLFRDHDEYVRQLTRYEPQIAMSLGYYMKRERTAFFYAGDPSVETTWYHEATHQLFQELGNAVDDVGEQSNFWAVEGIAVYMESLIPGESHYTLGGFDADRLQFARARALSGEYAMPLSELTMLGREALQKHEEIRRIYTQAAGLTHFFMDGAEGTRRQAFVDFLTLLYLGRAGPNQLAVLCGQNGEELDASYLEYLGVRDEDLKFLIPPEFRRNLALSHTAITDEGMQWLAGSSRLEWLDLSFTQVTDRGLAHLRDARSLRRLSLEGTRATEQALELIGQFPQLEELDLSKLPIRDASLAQLAGLHQLKVLWLAGTAISDAGLRHLETLSQLEHVDVSDTQVTAAGLQSLNARLPKLKLE